MGRSDRFRPFLRQIGAVLRHLLLAAVPAERLFRLRSLDPDRFVWEAVATWPEAVEGIRAKPVEMAVVDPLLGGVDAPNPRDRPSAPVLPLPAAPGLHRPHPGHGGRAAGAGAGRDSAGRRPSVRGRAGIAAERAAGGARAERVTAGHPGHGAHPARSAAGAAHRARSDAARARRGADRHRAGGARPAHAAYLRALVHQGRSCRRPAS